MTVLDELEITPVVNASATLTKLGGSLMPDPVVQAMSAASGAFVDIHELQRKASQRIATLTGNEACHISSGAAAGITLTVASCVAGTDPELQQAFPYLDGVQKTEIVVFGGQRNGYDYAARQTGVRLVEIEPSADQLRSAITDKTACVLFFAGAHFAEGGLPVEQVIEIGHDAGVPVIVDAAAQIPPISSLWHFTKELGADAAIFSGGKGLRGPQVGGLIVGTQKIIDGCRANGTPNHSLGRPMKVGKEELAGMLAAVEWSLEQDEEAILEGYEQSVQNWVEDLVAPNITIERRYPSEAGQPHGRAIVTVLPDAPFNRQEVVDALWERSPRIAVGDLAGEETAFALNPQTLEPGEDELVTLAVREVVAALNERGEEPS